MQKIETIFEIRKLIKNIKSKKQTIAIVPTMGALHQGHLALAKKAQNVANKVIFSIFVNKKQFNEIDDFNKYPRDIEHDCQKLAKAGVDYVFAPSDVEIYQAKTLIQINALDLTDCLCGSYRHNHFAGVCLIIAKLFNIIEPDFAIFGEKDFQQLQIIRRLVSDVNFPVNIVAQETLRNNDGLAMSSRNSLLKDNGAKQAAQIYQTLNKIRKDLALDSSIELSKIIKEAKTHLIKSGFSKIDYLEIRKEDDLQLVHQFSRLVQSRIFFAGYLQGVRLIDNLSIY